MRVLVLLLAVMSCVLPCLSAAKTQPTPVATLDLQQFFPSNPSEKPPQHPRRTNIAFLSDSVIATGVCKSGDCLLVLTQWDGSTLQPFAQTHRFFEQTAIYLTAQGNLLTLRDWDDWHPAHLYSPDLSVEADLIPLRKSSQSGNTVAEQRAGGWNLYHLDTQADAKLTLIHSATGELVALSDEVAVFHDDGGIRTETLQGKVLGSFKVKDYKGVEPRDRDKLLLHDGKGLRVVDFNGTEQLRLRVLKESGPYVFVAVSADKKKVLSDTFSRTASAPVGWANIASATIALGVDWAPTRERVQVVDTATGGSCFKLHRSFAEGSENGSHNAALSPSGEFLAVAVDGVLSVYRLPAVCGAKR
jgi:hypothetical protein